MSNNDTLPAVELEQLLSGAQLPALPQSAIQLLELSNNQDNGPEEYAAPIEADPGLAGQVLRFVNSSYFGFSREISSVKLAITLVGIRTIKNFALWSAVFSLMPNPKCGPFDLKLMWQDSLLRGLFSRAFGKQLKLPEAEDLFAAALLQDMAIPLLSKQLADEYIQLFEARENSNKRLSQLEQERFGWDHADAAEILASTWKLPEEFANYIKTHTKLEEILEDENYTAASKVVALSALLPAASSQLWSERELFESAINTIAGSQVNISELFEQVDQEFAEFAPVLKLAAPAKSLLEYFNDAEEEQA